MDSGSITLKRLVNFQNVTMNNVHEITKIFEQKLCEYTGSPYAIALDNCCNALYLSLCYEKLTCKSDIIELPSHTYVGVPCEVIRANFRIKWIDSPRLLKGSYQLSPTRVYDSALRFTSNMYIPNTLMCLSFTGQWKHN
jgi:dTDP-4-amino-4,6-dideoxygalactose transaminase